MCSTELGFLDMFLDRDGISSNIHSELIENNDLLVSRQDQFDISCAKEALPLDSSASDWKMSSVDFDDELLKMLNGDVVTPSLNTPTLGGFDDMYPISSSASELPSSGGQVPFESSLSTPTFETPDELGSLDNLGCLPFQGVLDSSASDSGLSTDTSSDQQVLSPASVGCESTGSLWDTAANGVGGGLSSDHLDTSSEISSSSDLDSLGSLAVASPHTDTSLGVTLDGSTSPDSGISSPVHQQQPRQHRIIQLKPQRPQANRVAKPSIPEITVVSRPAASASGQGNSAIIGRSSTPVFKTVTVSAAPSGGVTHGRQTIVVTQPAKSATHLVNGSALLKTANSRSILLPVTVKDLNQVGTIKIISARSGATTVLPRVVSSVKCPTSTVRTSVLRTAVPVDSKAALKASPAAGVDDLPSFTFADPVKEEVSFKEEPIIEDERTTGRQELLLSDEERRLLQKEGITLPEHYPLTKQEERELKRIRRKIRNKISAQDSRKRKKDYIDGLEDRVRACTEENQQLQKRIRHLEAQNESLASQMRRFQSLMTGGGGRLHGHASTAFMMLILSVALFIAPSLRTQDSSKDAGELSVPSKMPSAGHSRSLLEAGKCALTLEGMEKMEDVAVDPEDPADLALSDHDYVPPAKQHQRASLAKRIYYVPPLDDLPPYQKSDPGGGGTPDGMGESKFDTDKRLDWIANNLTDPGGKKTIVVKLGQGVRQLEDLELE